MIPAETRHASCVALAGRAALITGAHGAGKSRLALELIALGAELVADDLVALRREGDAVLAAAPPGAPGLIEARGVGLLPAPTAPETPLSLLVDLDRAETERLPPRRVALLLGARIPLILAPASAAAVALWLRRGPPRDPDAPLEEPTR